jgi:hypothetical protein
VSGGVVLDATPDVVDAGQAQFDDVEGVQYPGGVRKSGGQGGGVAAERI